MRMVDLIMKKRNGGALTKEEIDYFIAGYTAGEIPDYQVSALLMAIYFQKMTYEETLNLTLAMAYSGDVMDLSFIPGVKADKHSTGGVGDKTSLVLAPLVASLGVTMAKMSGRGLGHTGGTIDKLESFTGFQTALTQKQFMENISRVGMAITGQTGNLAPADKKLYALRDVTATVDNISLIASSIMSKKIAAGADAIVLDVKTGSGAFMKKESEAFELAREMVRIGSGAKKNTIAVVSDMDQPLGYAVGNALEVQEAIATLQGKGPKDLQELCLTLGSSILRAADKAKSSGEAREMLCKAIESGAAMDKFVEFVTAQGGSETQARNGSGLPGAQLRQEVLSERDGYVSHICSDEIGLAVMALGGGRETKESTIDLSVGVILHKKCGDYVKAGEPVATIYANDSNKAVAALKQIKAAYELSLTEPDTAKLIKGVVTAADC